MWTTEAYDEVGSGVLKRGVSVSALAFFNGSNELLVAVDKQGNLRKFDCPLENHQNSPSRIAVVEETVNWTVGAEGGESASFLQHQFSSDGMTLANICSEMHSTAGQHRSEKCDIYDIREGFDANKKISLNFGSLFFGLAIPVLSKNGSSLLVNRFNRVEGSDGDGSVTPEIFTEIVIYPSLVMEPGREQQALRVSGDRACWGLDGEYVMVWNTKHGQPLLSIYRTSEIASKRDGSSHSLDCHFATVCSPGKQWCWSHRQRMAISASSSTR